MKGRCPTCGEGEIVEGADGKWRCEKCFGPGTPYRSWKEAIAGRDNEGKEEVGEEHTFSWMEEE